ncbi:arginase family protein [Peribacillus sp. NPDC096622]|uniref:arginase family protein n=1 Tax=Peribacillus sp. NPDC096622 TaxID=3364396 RepID=UPI00381DF897
MNCNKKYIINPSIKTDQDDTHLTIILPYEKKKIRFSHPFNKVLDLIAKPIELNQLIDYGISNEIFNFLHDENILIPIENSKLYEYGLLKQPENIIGKKLALSSLKQDMNFEGQCCFIGVPVSFEHKGILSPISGTSQIRSNIKIFDLPSGSDADIPDEEYIYDTNRNQFYKRKDVLPFDLGDICYDARMETMYDVNQKINFTVNKIVEHGLKPIALGGDHTITYSIVSSLMEYHDSITIIHFDAHTDRYEGRYKNKDGLTIGNVFSEIMKNKKFHKLYQVGIREFETKSNSLQVQEDSCHIHTAHEIHSLEDVTSIFSTLDKNDPIYISFDIDVLDPVYAPEVAWPVIGGLNFHQVFTLITYLSQHFNVIGADFVEVCAGEKKFNLAALSAAKLATLIALNQKRKITNRGEECAINE